MMVIFVTQFIPRSGIDLVIIPSFRNRITIIFLVQEPLIDMVCYIRVLTSFHRVTYVFPGNPEVANSVRRRQHHCCLRLTWSREHAFWTPQQWSCVIFFDESRFSLQSDSRRTLIWRAPGTRYHQENTIERHRYGGAGWLIWGGIILGSRIDLHVQSNVQFLSNRSHLSGLPTVEGIA
ncbi:transposable element Tcb2 transposase [Trichonephila clavipes]|nr:transposable element Tcb2 transposase [Trichonephila clavipes]